VRKTVAAVLLSSKPQLTTVLKTRHSHTNSCIHSICLLLTILVKQKLEYPLVSNSLLSSNDCLQGWSNIFTVIVLTVIVLLLMITVGLALILGHVSRQRQFKISDETNHSRSVG